MHTVALQEVYLWRMEHSVLSRYTSGNQIEGGNVHDTMTELLLAHFLENQASTNNRDKVDTQQAQHDASAIIRYYIGYIHTVVVPLH